MATRTIVTSQPDVACDVCERRLLRGEQHDIFLAAGRRRTVCELCAPRAAHEGWMRERDSQSMTLPPMRPRRGRSLLERLPVPFRARPVGRQPAAGAEPAPAPAPGEGDLSPQADAYDFLDGYGGGGAGAVPASASAREASAAELYEQPAEGRPTAAAVPARDPRDSYEQRALEVFNASEFPRRVAGVARSLGAPEVSVRSAEHLASVVLVLVAWELCWYRYEVDLSEEPPTTRLLAQGSELSELGRDERLANVLAGETGALSLALA